MGITRRRLLASTVGLSIAGLGAPALGRNYVGGSLPWEPADTSPPVPVRPGPWLYFTAEEAAAVEAIVDRLIPPERIRARRQAGWLCRFHRSPTCRPVWRLQAAVHAPAVCTRARRRRAAIAHRAEGALPPLARRAG